YRGLPLARIVADWQLSTQPTARLRSIVVVKYVDAIKRAIGNTDRAVHLLDAAVQGIANHSELVNQKLSQIVQGLTNQAGLSNNKFDQAIDGLRNQTQVLNEKLAVMIANQQAQLELQRKQVEALEKLAATGRGETK